MAWIPSHQELKDHPKTKRLRRALGVGLPQAIGHLHMLWWWALDYAEDGRLSKWTADDIADAAGWEGEAKQFVDALVESGFLDRDGDTLMVHDWDEYLGRLLDKRRKNAERKRRSRENAEGGSGESRGSHAGQERDGQGSHRATEQNTTQENLKNPSRSTSPGGDAEPGRKAVFTDGDMALAELLARRIAENNPRARSPTASQLRSWANEVRLMRERDGHSLDEIREVLEWSQRDPFWRVNVLSMGSLRKQWNRLTARMENRQVRREQWPVERKEVIT